MATETITRPPQAPGTKAGITGGLVGGLIATGC